MQSDSHRLDDVLSSPVEPYFQPIFDLDSMSVVGYEALARWPSAPDISPLTVFEYARSVGRLAELDWECRRASVYASLEAGLSRPLSLFVNVEPRALRSAPQWPFPGERFREISGLDLQIIVELTERDLLADPAAVMAAVDWARDRDCGIALDDVGPNPESLALLPLVLPDVVKLDRGVITSPMTPQFDDTVSFVVDYAATTGATILAEGIEEVDDLAVARTVGATLGQGYLLGRPAAAPRDTPVPDPDRCIATFEFNTPALHSPADILDRLPPQVSTYSTIMRVFDEVTDLGQGLISPGCLVVAVQNPASFLERFGHQYEEFAKKHTLVGVIGAGEITIPGVRGALSPEVAFPGQFAIAVLNQTYAATIVARDLGDSGPLADRRYAWYYTHDRAAARDVARCIVSRLAPATPLARPTPSTVR